MISVALLGMGRRVVTAIGSFSIAVTLMIVGAAAQSSGAPALPTGPAPPSTAFGLLGSLEGDAPAPLHSYPRRPGARYEDVEASPKFSISIGGARLRVRRWSIEPRSSAPRAKPGDMKRAAGLGLIDAYSPSVNDAPGDRLHVVIRAVPTFVLPVELACIATAASDGTALLSYTVPKPKPSSASSSTSSTTARISTSAATSTTFSPASVGLVPRNVNLYFPLGARRGRFYLTCVGTTFESRLGENRAVWGLDV